VALPFVQRIVEQRILEAQKAGQFDNLPGQGKPLQLEDLSSVPEDLRPAYIILRNANVLPPEAELLKEIHTLQELLEHVYDEDEQRTLLREIQFKSIRLDLLKRRSFGPADASFYRQKLLRKFRRR
jgi:DnaJ homologue, subfamily C, member 28, conserved domain